MTTLKIAIAKKNVHNCNLHGSFIRMNQIIDKSSNPEENHTQQVSDYIFVYGTLRGDSPTGAHREYLQHSDFVAPAKIRGRLFLIDYYPGLMHDENALTDNEQWVTGEVYLLQDQKQLHQLDVYEGCAPNSPRPHEYKRTIVKATLPNKEVMETWAYIYIGETASLKRIDTGDFLRPAFIK